MESHHGSNAGLPILKPWRISTDIAELREDLAHMRCPGPAEHPVHAPCMGRDTVESGFYTDELVDVIHTVYFMYKLIVGKYRDGAGRFVGIPS